MGAPTQTVRALAWLLAGLVAAASGGTARAAVWPLPAALVQEQVTGEASPDEAAAGQGAAIAAEPAPVAENDADAAGVAPPTDSDAPTDTDAATDPVASVDELAAAGLELVVPAGPVSLGWTEVGVSGALGEGATLVLAEPPADTLVGAESNQSLSFGGRRLTLRLGLMRSGPLVLSGLTLADGGREWRLPDLHLEVAPAVADGRPARVRSLVAPLPLPLPRTLLAAFYLGGVLGALLAGLYVVRATRAVLISVVSVPADQLALEALARLRASPPRLSDDVPGFLLAVSDVLRRYIEGRFDVHAPSRTTEEFLQEAVAAEGQLAERTATLEQFLTLCDLVKYARHRPATSEAGALLDTAQTFVEETR